MSNTPEIFRGAPREWTTYLTVVKSDSLKYKYLVKAENVWGAKDFICKYLSCPASAVVSVAVHYPSLTIYQVKRIHEAKGGKYFFSRQTLRFFGQRLSDFSVVKDGEGGYIVAAPIKRHGVNTGHWTKQSFNPNTGEFNSIKE